MARNARGRRDERTPAGDRREEKSPTLDYLSRQHGAGAGAMISGERVVREEARNIASKRTEMDADRQDVEPREKG